MVALGAAVQAGLIAGTQSVDDLVVTDVAPFTLGMEISKLLGSNGTTGYFLPIIHRNTTIPISRVERVGTVEPNQTRSGVQIYQGESRHVGSNLFLGEFEVKGIPRGPAGQSIDVRFTYDLNGVLEVEATVVETGKAFDTSSRGTRQGMSAGDISKAVADMQSLKRHPRRGREPIRDPPCGAASARIALRTPAPVRGASRRIRGAPGAAR